MKITPRANEVAAVEAVLLSDEYETERDMAKAVISALAAELGRRDWFVMTWRLPGEDSGVNYGPFATRAELAKHAGRMPDGEHGAVLVLGPDRPRTMVETDVAGECACSHMPEQHVVKMQRGRTLSKPQECGVFLNRRTKCPCVGYSAK